MKARLTVRVDQEELERWRSSGPGSSMPAEDLSQGGGVKSDVTTVVQDAEVRRRHRGA